MAALSASVSSVSSVYQYSCLPGTDLLAGWSNSAGLAALRTFEPHRDLIASIANTFQGQPIGSFAYANDAIARRVSRADQSAISAQSVATNLFACNARSELLSAQMGTNAYGYVYDPIGNRITASNNAEELSHAANALNQYTAIASTRDAPATPLFDADGNLTNDGRFAYTWDAENRLIAAQALNQEPGTTNRLTFVFDYMSRRVAKTIGGTTHHFLYDGWAMIQEETGAHTNSYVYGLDLSGSLQGAGTIGGILCASLNWTQAFYFFDANGNVSDLADPNGTSLAHYEFDPYGNTIAAIGTHAAANPFRFSTKYTDEETGLVYYGYRYYSSQLGRWLNRDPKEEPGSRVERHVDLKSSRVFLDLYLFCRNRAVMVYDFLGLEVRVTGDCGKCLSASQLSILFNVGTRGQFFDPVVDNIREPFKDAIRNQFDSMTFKCISNEAYFCKARMACREKQKWFDVAIHETAHAIGWGGDYIDDTDTSYDNIMPQRATQSGRHHNQSGWNIPTGQ
jgi:RHS repeat-associated protein